MKRKIARVFLELMRHHVTVMAIMAAVNMALIITGSKYIIYFSALLPQLLTSNGFSMALTSGYAPLETIAIVLSGVFIVLLLLAVAFSYKKRGWFFVSAALIAADLSLAFVMLFRDGNMSFLPDIIINAYILLVTVGAFFVAGVLYPKATADEEDSGEETTPRQDELTVGYGEYLIPEACAVSAKTVIEEGFEEKLQEENKAQQNDTSLSSSEAAERGELEDGVLLKVTFRLPTIKSIKNLLFADDEEEK